MELQYKYDGCKNCDEEKTYMENDLKAELVRNIDDKKLCQSSLVTCRTEPTECVLNETRVEENIFYQLFLELIPQLPVSDSLNTTQSTTSTTTEKPIVSNDSEEQNLDIDNPSNEPVIPVIETTTQQGDTDFLDGGYG